MSTDGRTDRQTDRRMDTKKVIVAFRDCAKEPKNCASNEQNGFKN